MTNNYEENKEVTKQLEAIFDKLDEVCHNSEISRTDAFNEQVIYILFARLLGRLDMKKSLFVDDLKHLKLSGKNYMNMIVSVFLELIREFQELLKTSQIPLNYFCYLVQLLLL